jgi:hypothetical protein
VLADDRGGGSRNQRVTDLASLATLLVGTCLSVSHIAAPFILFGILYVASFSFIHFFMMKDEEDLKRGHVG